RGAPRTTARHGQFAPPPRPRRAQGPTRGNPVSDRRLDELLRSGELPEEENARARAWNVVRAAYAEREPVAWPRKHARPLLAAAAAAALVAAALTPPGMAVFKHIRNAVGTERVKRANPALSTLPGGGALLVTSSS